jgi:hypothetical protein
LGRLRDLVGIKFGSSEIEPAHNDARFKDDSWRDNPIFRRMGKVTWRGGVRWTNGSSDPTSTILNANARASCSTS